MAVGQNPWYFGVGAPPILVYFSGDWDVDWRYDLDFDPWPNSFGWVGLQPAVKPGTAARSSTAHANRLNTVAAACRFSKGIAKGAPNLNTPPH